MEKQTLLFSQRDKTWVDADGNDIPREYVNDYMRACEKAASKVHKQASKAHAELLKLQEVMDAETANVYNAHIKQYKRNPDTKGKGSFSFKSFNGSVKIEVKQAERIEFDDLTLDACKEKLDEFIDKNTSSENHFIKKIIHEAFETSRGKVDTKQVMSLLRYTDQIKDPDFTHAMELLTQAISRQKSKAYQTVSERDERGEYRGIELNFSKI